MTVSSALTRFYGRRTYLFSILDIRCQFGRAEIYILFFLNLSLNTPLLRVIVYKKAQLLLTTERYSAASVSVHRLKMSCSEKCQLIGDLFITAIFLYQICSMLRVGEANRTLLTLSITLLVEGSELIINCSGRYTPYLYL